MARFDFRHGIARRQQDSASNPNNLQPSNGGSYLDLIVSPDPTVFIISHYDTDYMQSENASVSKAWGPFVSGIDYWIYWDIDFQTGELTRQFTTIEPHSGNTPPSSPQLDQHWFDTDDMVMKVWSGGSWVEKVRCFAAKYQGGASVIYSPLRSQVGKNDIKTNAGKILFDPDNKPLQKFQRNRRGQFITTETPLNSQFNRIANFRVEAAIVQGEAQEYVPIHHAVAFSGFDELLLARSSDATKPAIGIATEDMYPGEIRSYITKGFITDEVNWNWSAYPPNTGLFVGSSGELLPAPEASATTQQQIGYIVNRNTIFVEIGAQVLLEPPSGNEIGLLVDRDSGRRIGRKFLRVLDDLKDVDVDNPQDGDVIRWNDTTHQWELDSSCCGGGSGGASAINDLVDVNAPGPITNGFSLTYNATSGMWEPEEKVRNLFDLGDVVVMPDEGDHLVFRGSWWVSEPQGVSPTAPAAAGLFVTNITSPGNGVVGDFAYVPNTVPTDIVVTEATSDQEIVRVHFIVEGARTTYTPAVTVDAGVGDVPGILTQDAHDIRTFHGYADISIADGLLAGRNVDLVASHGAIASVLIKRSASAAQIQTMMFDVIYPPVSANPTSGYAGGVQTAIKSGDVFYVTGTVDNSATLVSLNTGGAVGTGTFTTSTSGSSLGAVDSGGVGYRTFDIRFTASSASSAQTATAIAYNAFGSVGPSYTTTNTVVMDQDVPNVSVNSFSYPIGQQALKSTEIVNAINTVLDYDHVYYFENGGAGFINILNPNTFESSKSVARIGGDYLYHGNNFAITAYKTSNGTSTTSYGDVNISNVAPTVQITGATSRLISSPSGEHYNITLTFSQQLLQAPTITSSGDVTAGDRGVWSGGGTTWSFNLEIDDVDVKGVYNWMVDDVNTLSNNTYNNIVITSGSSYEIGGFTTRLVTVGALEQVVDLGVDITDPSKIVTKYAGTADNLTYRASDLTQFQKGWSAIDGSALIFTTGPEPFPNYSNFVFQDPLTTPTSWFYLTDASFAGANTTGTLLIEIGEGA